VACILGSAPARFDPVGIRTAGSLLRRNGELVGTGAPGVLLGSPLAALLRLVETAGRPPTADSCLLLGSITPTVPAEAGDRFDLRVAGLGGVSGRLLEQPQRSER
jgi:2-keto-4-pentenoate hydratase